MKFDYFDIHFGETNRLYYSGQILKGAVVFSVPQAIKINGILVELKGEANTGWVNKTSDKIYDTKMTLFSQVKDLTNYLREISDGELLPEGAHSLQFEFKLPENLYSSIYNEYFGNIAYYCTATVHIEKDSCIAMLAGTDALNLTKSLQVHALVAADSAHLLQPYCHADTVQVVGCCRAKGSLAASLSLQKTGYMPGEKIGVDVKLTNMTKRAVKGRCPVLVLIQQLHFRAENRYEPLLHDTKDINQVLDSVGMQHADECSEIVRKVELRVPETTPPTSVYEQCPVCITYYLKVQEHASRARKSIKNRISIKNLMFIFKLEMDVLELVAPIVIGSYKANAS